jgi:hypothetical protein
MVKLLTVFLAATVSLSAAGFPHGGDLPHKPGAEYSNPGLILDTPPFTPGYHNGADMVCSDCHIMHASMQHGYGTPDAYTYPYEVNPPSANLLKASSPLQLCLTCHEDMVGIPDVVGSDVNGGVMRAAGQLDAVGMINDNGHNLAESPGDICSRCHYGGEFHTAAVECIDCHAPHGTNYYRNLQWASWPGHQPPIIAFTRPGVTDLQKYQAANIRYGAPGDGMGQPTWREVTNICIDCHHSIQDAGVNGGRYTNPELDMHWNRHPGNNSENSAYRPIGGLPGDPFYSADSANWIAGDGSEFSIGRLPYIVKEAHSFDAADIVAGSNEVFCLSCHAAHGSDHSFGLRWNAAENSNTLRTAGCRQCHNSTAGNIE